MKHTNVSIIGAAGYGAAELLRNLLPRPDVNILKISSKDYIGQKVGHVHRSLWGYSDLIIEDIAPQDCAAGADVVFLAMPHVITAKVAMELFDMGVRIIDLSGDFRLHRIEDYQNDYAANHPCPERLGTFVYGMPEINLEQIKSATHVACPGCFATAITLGLLPLADSGILKRTTIRTVAMTGSSGSGVKPQAGTHHPVRTNNIKTYKTLNHQHRSEILQTLKMAGAQEVALDFAPVSVPLSRGILAVSLMDMPTEPEKIIDLRGLYHQYYHNNPNISVMPPGVGAEVVAVAGTARVEISLESRTDKETGQRTLCCISAIDNLIKGGAGQAIQCFNLMTGKDLNCGLDQPGLWP